MNTNSLLTGASLEEYAMRDPRHERCIFWFIVKLRLVVMNLHPLYQLRTAKGEYPHTVTCRLQDESHCSAQEPPVQIILHPIGHCGIDI